MTDTTLTQPKVLSTKVYHESYGLTDSIRIKALRLAEVEGVSFAARVCNVSPSTLYKWRKDMLKPSVLSPRHIKPGRFVL